MRKYIFLLFFLAIAINVLAFENAYGFDIRGLQPVTPYGVFSTFSADSPQKGIYNFEAVAEKSFEPDFNRYTMQFSYGITNSIEVLAALPYIDRWVDTEAGFEDFAFGLKHRFFDEGKYGPSIAYVLNASANSGKDEFGTDGKLGGGLVASKRVGPVTGHANAFYEKAGSSRSRDEMKLAAGFDFSASHNFKLLAELYAKKTHDSDKFDQVEGRIGYRFITADNIFTTIGMGFDLKQRSPEYRILFSIAVRFPKEKKTIKKIYEEDK